MYEVQAAPGIIWHRHINQLKPTAVEHAVEVTDTDTVEVSQPEAASTPPAPIQLSAPPNGRSTGDGSCSHTHSSRPSWSDSSQSYGPWGAVPSESSQGTTETRSLNRFSVFPCFLFFLETVRYRTLLVDLVVSLWLYLRLSYKLGTDHFCVEEVLWSPCAFTI